MKWVADLLARFEDSAPAPARCTFKQDLDTADGLMPLGLRTSPADKLRMAKPAHPTSNSTGLAVTASATDFLIRREVI